MGQQLAHKKNSQTLLRSYFIGLAVTSNNHSHAVNARSSFSLLLLLLLLLLCTRIQPTGFNTICIMA